MSVLPKKANLDIVILHEESFIKITDVNEIRPFFMNIVSDSNHWMFASSNGGISAGRKNPEFALFPYYTDDKITESIETSGSKTIFKIHDKKGIIIWEPFKDDHSSAFNASRNLYKSLEGNKIVFEEINHDLGLTFRYQWNNSNLYGIVKKAELINDSADNLQITLLDGIQNILPFGISSDMQRFASNLGDAYKRNELDASSGLGIYALSAMIVDKAEPSEALKANIAWSLGFDNPKYLLSSLQLNNFRKGLDIKPEFDVKGEKGAYFVIEDVSIKAKDEKCWTIIANVNQTQSNIVALSKSIRDNEKLKKELEDNIDLGTKRLKQLVGSADGLQLTQDRKSDIRHYSNVLFNIMRGGIFDDNYIIEKEDFIDYLQNANDEVVERNEELLKKLDDKFQRALLKDLLKDVKDSDLIRLTIEYLPIKFSRRHGDPSRPWNYFTINTRDETNGKKILDYEGNWRDIFQNWEALAHSYPEYIDGMIFKFLNNSTFDGYNPYRITKKGFDWETIEPDDPWSYIGYWGDHQVIYLLKFLEFAENYFPNKLDAYLDQDLFVYAAVPYIIKPYWELLEDPQDTIEFSEDWDAEIRQRKEKYGADGALLMNKSEQVHKVNMLEKLLAMVLSKLSNFIPEAGIWMNTQRPEWNDANNALVGNGVSMVTLYYLRRYLHFMQKVLQNTKSEKIGISSELGEFYIQMQAGMSKFQHLLKDRISDKDRKQVLDHFGNAASDFRTNVYNNGFSGNKSDVVIEDIERFFEISIAFIDHSIKVNKRKDNLYHSYNLMESSEDEIRISHLDEMLEGQVAVLSSGYLSSSESLEVLDSLRASTLYRQDQNSYILYPNKELKGFLHKNTLIKSQVEKSKLLSLMIHDGNHQIIEQDMNGNFHFNGGFRNVDDLSDALLNSIPKQYGVVTEKEKSIIENLYEKVFNHKAFTGRSGTFFAYEGLGSIYWHMVSKLLLATQESCFASISEGKPKHTEGLINHYFNIKDGIGLHKSPELYGAFPTDPYSHTPMHRGAQQPGMTGQVKEDVLSNYGELGIFIEEGRIKFKPLILREKFFTDASQIFNYVDKKNNPKKIEVKKDSLGFTFCQTPVIYELSDKESIKVQLNSGKIVELNSLELGNGISHQIFDRAEEIESIKVLITKKSLIHS